ncbi:MAG: PbpA [Proteobacteria bacterium]|nr:PbpA [Pseudomonadota bacterium]MBU1389394.1 PbpA [Pseudomonadota bacterium]MBU1541214.1 PbpA [Pseudomonadota bacterium]MBU2430057.1 PbpA [Pseudomonadota bacterium]
MLAILILTGVLGFFSVNAYLRFTADKKNDPARSLQQADELTDPDDLGKSGLSKEKLTHIISTTPFSKTDKNIFFVNTPEESYKITTSIDIYLQEYLLSVMEKLKKLDRGKPQQIALVVMEADSGKILAMTGFDLDNPDTNPCVQNYPAASIFKIVTAAAAVETLGYKPQTPLYFNGNKYTLYKRQLKDVKNKYTYKISFASAFAESINPVFGKIGKNSLGKIQLETYADAFGFNQIIDSELPLVSGSFEIGDSDYHLAELGCGFNNDTTISPVFGAMLTAAIINSGNVMVPSIVEHVTGSDGKIIYKNRKSTYKTAIRPETADTMMQLMEKTITKGTARKSFRGASKDTVLSTLVIGGKTGSLYNTEHTIKYDWFTGFAAQKDGNTKITLSIVVGHGKYIGTRAGTYAKMILKQYFKKNDDITAQL